MRVLVPAIAAGSVLVGFARRGSLPARVGGLLPAPPTSAPPDVPARLGRPVSRLLGRPADRRADATMGYSLIALVSGALLVHPLVGLAATATVHLVPWWGDRRADQRLEALIADELPDVVDLLMLAIDGGLGPRQGIEAVSRVGDGPVADAMRAALRRVAGGERLGDALETLPRQLGPVVHPLVAALVSADRYGTPLLRSLDAVERELRDDRRRRAEDAARRVPVRLVFPLVFCTLPAFALLTVVPLLAGSLQSLHW